MKLKWLALMLMLCVSGLAQDTRKAHATYSVNGVLISLSDLSPLRTCSVRSLDGKVKSVRVKGGTVVFELKTKEDRATFQFPTSILASAEQVVFKKNLIRKGLRLRASGYACRDDAYEAISVERVY